MDCDPYQESLRQSMFHHTQSITELVLLFYLARQLLGGRIAEIVTWTSSRLIIQLAAQQLQGKESSPSVPESLKQ
jgi:hypothetical protein